MKKTGELLRNARESKNLSLNEVSLALKINSRILKAIEDGDPDNLPAKTFLRGFVKSYATFLKSNADEILDSFMKEVGSTNPKTEISSNPESNEGSPSEGDSGFVKARPQLKKVEPSPLKENSSRPSALYFVLAAVIITCIFFVKKMIDRYEKESEVSEIKIEEKMKSTETAPLPKGEVSNSSGLNKQTNPLIEEPGKQSHPEGTEVNNSASDTTGAHTASPSISQKISNENNQNPTSKATISNNGEINSSVAGPGAPPSNPSAEKKSNSPSVESETAAPTPPLPTVNTIKPVEVLVEALDGVEIEYSTSSSKAEKINLRAEQVYTIKSKGGVKLNISNGGAVNLFVNGKDIGVPGDLGKPIKLTY